MTGRSPKRKLTSNNTVPGPGAEVPVHAGELPSRERRFGGGAGGGGGRGGERAAHANSGRAGAPG